MWHWRATATAFQPQEPSVPHSTTATPGNKEWRTAGLVRPTAAQDVPNWRLISTAVSWASTMSSALRFSGRVFSRRATMLATCPGVRALVAEAAKAT
eukprot:3856612-Alexandrium_andersonii.AAC.1